MSWCSRGADFGGHAAGGARADVGAGGLVAGGGVHFGEVGKGVFGEVSGVGGGVGGGVLRCCDVDLRCVVVKCSEVQVLMRLCSDGEFNAGAL